MGTMQTGIAGLVAVSFILGVGVDQALAENASEGIAVPANKAGFHVPVFQNDW